MKHLLLIQLFFIALGLQAQQNSIAAGGEANGQEGTISYTVGQTIYTFKSYLFCHGFLLLGTFP